MWLAGVVVVVRCVYDGLEADGGGVVGLWNGLL